VKGTAVADIPVPPHRPRRRGLSPEQAERRREGQARRSAEQARIDRVLAQRATPPPLEDQAEEEEDAAAWKLWTERHDECLHLLQSLAGVRTVRLSPRSLAILAGRGYGEEMVRAAVHALVDAGLAELRWERSGLDDVPVVQAA
jgi:hypothetical protein